MSPERYIALLRGINVGGRNKLAMKDLVRTCEGIGYEDVKTYIQSGNVVFSAATPPQALSQQLTDAIATAHGLDVPVVIRSANTLKAVVEANPFTDSRIDAKALHVGFLKQAPTQKQIDALDPNRSPTDTFQLFNREIYLFCPNGLGRTKLTTGYFDRTLGTVTTVRNWNTVLKLLAMTIG